MINTLCQQIKILFLATTTNLPLINKPFKIINIVRLMTVKQQQKQEHKQKSNTIIGNFILIMQKISKNHTKFVNFVERTLENIRN